MRLFVDESPYNLIFLRIYQIWTKLDKFGFKIGLFWMHPNPWYYWIFQQNANFWSIK